MVQMAQHHTKLEVRICAMMEEHQKIILDGVERLLQEQILGCVPSQPRTVIRERPRASEGSNVKAIVSKRTSTSTSKGIVSVESLKRNFGTAKSMIIHGDRSASRTLSEASDHVA